MTDELKQTLIECLKIYVRTELARSIAHPSENKICTRWSNDAFMSIQNKNKIDIMNALLSDDYLEKYTLKDLWSNSFRFHNAGESYIYHYCNEPWVRPSWSQSQSLVQQCQHPYITYRSAIEEVKDAVSGEYTNKVVHTLTLSLWKNTILYSYEGNEKYAYQLAYLNSKAAYSVKLTDNCLNIDGFKKAYEKIEEQIQKNNELQQKFVRLRKLYEIKHICKEKDIC